jgi:hypothetical protein
VDGLTRSDVGEGYQGKGLYSDALKRAAVKFGVGVSLYAVPKIMLAKRDGLRDVRTQKGPSLALTDQGEIRCRAIYTDWLNDAGEAKFGQALDHGDVAGSVGDPEEMREEEGPQQAPQGQSLPSLDDETTQAITAVAKEAVDVGAIDAKRLRTELVSAGATTTASVAEAIATLTPQAADVFARMLSTIAMDVTRNSPVDGGEFGEGS